MAKSEWGVLGVLVAPVLFAAAPASAVECGASGPNCGGTCTGGKSCTMDGQGSCSCEDPLACGSSAPGCLGDCGAGEICQVSGETCACSSVTVSLCGDSETACGGLCPGIMTCALGRVGGENICFCQFNDSCGTTLSNSCAGPCAKQTEICRTHAVSGTCKCQGFLTALPATSDRSAQVLIVWLLTVASLVALERTLAARRRS